MLRLCSESAFSVKTLVTGNRKFSCPSPSPFLLHHMRSGWIRAYPKAFRIKSDISSVEPTTRRISGKQLIKLRP